MNPRARLKLQTFDGVDIRDLIFDELSLVHDAEGYDVMDLTGKIDQPALDGMAFDDFIDKRLVLERAGFNVPAMRTEATCFIRRVEFGRDTFLLRAYGPEYQLESRIVAYAADSTQATQTRAIDDMMKQIARENGWGPAVTVDAARIITGNNVTAFEAKGTSITKAFAHKNVLAVLKDLQEQSRNQPPEIFFRMIPNGTGWLLTTYSTRIGSDRRDKGMNLSEENENFVIESVGQDASQEINYMYAGGSGTEADRLIGTASDSARIALSPYNRREGFYSATLAKTQAAVNSAAQQELNRKRAARIFSGNIQERNNFRYGIEWDFGDILRAEHQGHTYDVMVRKVQIRIQPGGETISARVEVE